MACELFATRLVAKVSDQGGNEMLEFENEKIKVILLSMEDADEDGIFSFLKEKISKSLREIVALCENLPLIVIETESLDEANEVSQKLIDLGAEAEVESPEVSKEPSGETPVVSIEAIREAVQEVLQEVLKEANVATKKELSDFATKEDLGEIEIEWAMPTLYKALIWIAAGGFFLTLIFLVILLGGK